MRNSNHPRKRARPASDLYRAFINLDSKHRRELALRILGNQRLRADLYDQFLIRKAFEEDGRSIAWKS